MRMRTHSRLGLAQSLEQFAHRMGVTPSQARLVWRQAGLALLGVSPSMAAPDGPRVAPGVTYRTRDPYEAELAPPGHFRRAS